MGSALPRLQIVLLEDNDALRSLVSEALEEQGHKVISLASAEEFGEVYQSMRADLFIIDLTLPGEDGLSIAARMRARYPNVGIIMATARIGSRDRMLGYESGADVYLNKPFELGELTAVIAAVARRTLQATQVTAIAPGALVLSRTTLTLEGTDGSSAILSPDEAAVLHGLARAPAQELETWQIMEILGFNLDEGAKRNLEVRMVRLRKKIRRAGISGTSILPLRGKGYRLVTPIHFE